MAPSLDFSLQFDNASLSLKIEGAPVHQPIPPIALASTPVDVGAPHAPAVVRGPVNLDGSDAPTPGGSTNGPDASRVRALEEEVRTLRERVRQTTLQRHDAERTMIAERAMLGRELNDVRSERDRYRRTVDVVVDKATCFICTSYASRPHVLSCQHMLCGNCIRNQRIHSRGVRHAHGEIECPFCRTVSAPSPVSILGDIFVTAQELVNQALANVNPVPRTNIDSPTGDPSGLSASDRVASPVAGRVRLVGHTGVASPVRATPNPTAVHTGDMVPSSNDGVASPVGATPNPTAVDTRGMVPSSNDGVAAPSNVNDGLDIY